MATLQRGLRAKASAHPGLHRPAPALEGFRQGRSAWRCIQGLLPCKAPVQPRSAPCSRAQKYLGQVGRLPDPVDAAEGDDVRPAVALGVHHVAQDVHAALGLQDLHQGLLEGLLHCGGHRWETEQHSIGLCPSCFPHFECRSPSEQEAA